jgi:hypothetical protein
MKAPWSHRGAAAPSTKPRLRIRHAMPIGPDNDTTVELRRAGEPTDPNAEHAILPPPEGDPKKAPSGVRTSSLATSGIAAFAVTGSGNRRRYANTSRMRMTKTCRRACTNTSGAQFGSEREFHELRRALSSDRDRLHSAASADQARSTRRSRLHARSARGRLSGHYAERGGRGAILATYRYGERADG